MASLTIKRKRILLIIIIAAVVALFLFLLPVTGILNPTLKIVSGQAAAGTGDEVLVELELSAFPDRLYPAASLSVAFDKDKLEFTGVKTGSMMVYDNYVPTAQADAEPRLQNAEWMCNPQVSNEMGTINTMYLDMTGEKNAFGKDGFDKQEKNVVVRLGFKLKDNVQPGEHLELTFTDAVFATENGDKDGTSLSATQKTLTLVNGEIVVI